LPELETVTEEEEHVLGFLSALFDGTADILGSLAGTSSSIMVTMGWSGGRVCFSFLKCCSESSSMIEVRIFVSDVKGSLRIESVIVLLSLNILGGGITPVSLKVTLTGDTRPVRDPLTLKFFKSRFLASRKFS